MPTGSIFGIYTAGECAVYEGDGAEEILSKCLTNVRRSGNELAAAGYCMYSSATTLILTVGHGVYGARRLGGGRRRGGGPCRGVRREGGGTVAVSFSPRGRAPLRQRPTLPSPKTLP